VRLTQPPAQRVLNLLSGVRLAERGVDHAPSSKAEVKEREELHLCSPSGLHGGYRVIFNCTFTLRFLSRTDIPRHRRTQKGRSGYFPLKITAPNLAFTDDLAIITTDILVSCDWLLGIPAIGIRLQNAVANFLLILLLPHPYRL
jgi:hypothetical protein